MEEGGGVGGGGCTCPDNANKLQLVTGCVCGGGECGGGGAHVLIMPAD